ncbi:DUF2188 domain-containing protein [Oceanobacillus sp. FSL H7-0719]|uniref:DUF2188 domain-containing protein n=1 Tax=Oceanobacillus sp. FSL H7-0719 TaxID=2954507 RepID=UPI00325177E8
MPWTMDDYPASMKNLENVTRKKAIDIANSMLDEGYSDDQAIPIAIDQAKEWHENRDDEEIEEYRKHGKPTTRSKEGQKYRSNPERLDEGELVIAHEDGWAVKSSGAERVSETFANKKDAVVRGEEIADNKGKSLTVYKQDGTIEYKKDFNK